MQQTTNYALNLPEDSDFADISKLNENMEIIDSALKQALEDAKEYVDQQVSYIDCGLWDDETVETHNATPISHQNLMVDGNNTLTGDQSTTLEEHMANPLAHQNLVVDGNAV